LLADGLRIAGDRHLHATADAPRVQRQHERLKEHADPERVYVVEVAMHADHGAERCPKELPIP
jgi:hypothetical protein